ALAYFASLACLRRLSALTARFDTRRIAAVAALVGATAYAAMGGWGVALQRAWVCAIVVVGLSILGRRAASREALSGAALAVLALQPAALFDLGAQLSFAATAALLFDPWAGEPAAPNAGEIRSRGRARRFLGRSIRGSATALAATGPILALHGVAVTPVALLANLVLVPVFGFVVLPGCLLAVALAGLEAGEIVLHGLCALFDRLLQLLEFAGAALARLSVGGTPGGLAWIACAIFGGLTLCARRTRTRLLGSLLSVCALAIPGGLDPTPPYLVVLDVGRGDAIVFRGPEAAVLVDGGAAFRAGRDRGRSVVVPALEALGIEKLDVVIGSHADLDHRGGLPTVVRSIEVGEIWVPAGDSDGGFKELRRAARERSVPVFQKVAGDTAQLPGDVSLSTVWPVRGLAQGSRNDRSLVTRIDFGGVAVLLPGDVGFAAERAMLKQGRALDSHVLVLPHHGSANSVSAEFLGVVSPEVAVVSAPCEETSRLPARATLQRVKRHGAPVWWTGRDGAVVVSLRKPLSAWGWRQDSAAERCRWHGASGSAGEKAHGAFPGTSPKAGRPTPIWRHRTVR
ncbi:MAG: ComEC/Rec2 family competence protein, partial [Myxococcota bacterium]|nr:ComEC/Rec2 family competence protein [Myxococcota bacterium]